MDRTIAGLSGPFFSVREAAKPQTSVGTLYGNKVAWMEIWRAGSGDPEIA